MTPTSHTAPPGRGNDDKRIAAIASEIPMNNDTTGKPLDAAVATAKGADSPGNVGHSRSAAVTGGSAIEGGDDSGTDSRPISASN
jgi:hypothetical protein